jgi:hypothetical protein
MAPLDARREALEDVYGFVCGCPRCKEEERLVSERRLGNRAELGIANPERGLAGWCWVQATCCNCDFDTLLCLQGKDMGQLIADIHESITDQASGCRCT